jgi:thymidylate synthase (FAD)
MNLAVLGQMTVELISHSGGEELIAGTAGLCRGNDLTVEVIPKLLKLGHLSPFEFVTATFELYVPIFVARQIMRHRTFSYMERSLRVSHSEIACYRPNFTKGLNAEAYDSVVTDAIDTYTDLLDHGVAPEVARMMLPLATMTTFRMSGNLRNWMQFFQKRITPEAQMETRHVAAAIMALLFKVAPITINNLYQSMGTPEEVAQYVRVK